VGELIGGRCRVPLKEKSRPHVHQLSGSFKSSLPLPRVCWNKALLFTSSRTSPVCGKRPTLLFEKSNFPAYSTSKTSLDDSMSFASIPRDLFNSAAKLTASGSYLQVKQ
jgi:hypothetical protein